MKKIAVLGSTGSIGTQTLEVVRNNGDIRVTALAAGRNIEKLEEQVENRRQMLCRRKAWNTICSVADIIRHTYLPFDKILRSFKI